MKVMLHSGDDGTLMVYVPKKDLEEHVINQSRDGDTTFYTLKTAGNFPSMASPSR